ncbi:MAG: T9SS type A sorting domain-containing protein [Paludibacteraceae bacterium]|nr:T9SS type A sorting domain-containing protein [Paludibacteraceae bacterium]
MKKFVLLIIGLYAVQLFAQQYVHFNISQADELVVTTKDSVYIPINTTDTLGPVIVQGGTPPFQYQWTPSNYLVNSEVANATATGVELMVYTLTVTDNNGCTASDILVVDTTDIVSSISMIRTDGLFTVKYYEQGEKIAIESNFCLIENASVKLYDVNAQLISNQYITTVDKTIQFTNLNKGVYLVIIQYQNVTSSYKLLVR